MTLGHVTHINSFVGNGVNKEFRIDFPMAVESDLLVTVADGGGQDVVFLEGVDYSVKKEREDDEVTNGKLSPTLPVGVELTKALPTGWKITLERSTPISQSTSFMGHGFNATESAADTLTMICQELDWKIQELDVDDAAPGEELTNGIIEIVDKRIQEQTEETESKIETKLGAQIESVVSDFSASINAVMDSIEENAQSAAVAVDEKIQAVANGIDEKVRAIMIALETKMSTAPGAGLWAGQGAEWFRLEDGAVGGGGAVLHLPDEYQRSGRWTAAGGALVAPEGLLLDVGGVFLRSGNDPIRLDLGESGQWDDAGWTQAGARSGKDFYIYVCAEPDADQPSYVLSADASRPRGDSYTAENTRKIGGFHCLCADVGIIAGHALSGLTAGQVLPASVWDLRHRPIADPEGMVFSETTGKWYQIYMTDDGGRSIFKAVPASDASAAGTSGYPVATRAWFTDLLARKRMRLLFDHEFIVVSSGSNQNTCVSGDSYDSLTGGHVDTSGRRMISELGIEDCCGFMMQVLAEPSGISPADFGGGLHYTAVGGGGGIYGASYIAVAGGNLYDGANAGSMCRHVSIHDWESSWYIRARGCSEPMIF